MLLVEDSGLFIDALPDFPGVYSSFVFKSLGCEGILKLLEDNRDARFMTAAALWTGEAVEVFIGVCEGEISREIHGEGGFGYDPIFIATDANCHAAELDKTTKNRISHRGKAMTQLLQQLHHYN